MTKISLSSDIQGISKQLYSECIEHGHKIKCSFGEFQLYPITDLMIAIYSHGEFRKNVGEIDPFSFAGKNFEPITEGTSICFETGEIEKVIFKGIVTLLKNNKVLILNKQDYTLQQIISLDKFLETLNCAYSAMDRSFNLDPCTSEAYYATMLGYRITDAKDKYPEILKTLRSFEKDNNL